MIFSRSQAPTIGVRMICGGDRRLLRNLFLSLRFFNRSRRKALGPLAIDLVEVGIDSLESFEILLGRL